MRELLGVDELARVAGDVEDGEATRAAPQMVGELATAAHARHDDVRHDELDLLGVPLEELDGGLRTIGLEHGVAMPTERASGGATNGGLVLHEEQRSVCG
ncbi:MAG: hypothetical protein U0235_31750 [Polyangiaceae bacterium]